MNISELARRLRVSPEDLKTKLPGLGFDIGSRAIKIDDHAATQIIAKWNQMIREQVRSATAGAVAGEKAERSVATETRGPVVLPSVVTVREFALRLALPVTQVISELMKNGILASLNERIDYDTASIVAEDLGFSVTKEATSDGIEEVVGDPIREMLATEDPTTLVPRPPVVVVMGHVDHGKTKLLDAIRKTHVMEGEAGGITQHIGAYQTERNGRRITFLDTPGHEAFTAMRSRGAKVADVAVLVVAADDGVQAQTKEAVKIIQAAKLPMVVAINKIDKPEADPERVKRELADLGIMAEGWGGNVPMTPISAKQAKGINELLEIILLTADLNRERLLTNPGRAAVGTVIESHVDKREGVLSTVLVQLGTLRVQDILVVGKMWYGKVRAMKDWQGKLVKEAPPGMPVAVLGFRVAPQIGEMIMIANSMEGLERMQESVTSREKLTSTERVAHKEESAETPVQAVNVMVKADVLGSLEAIVVSFEKFKHPEVGVSVVGKGLGNVTEADVMLAESTHAVIYGFHVQVPLPVSMLARDKGVELRTTKTIYELQDDLKARLEKLLAPEIIRTKLGTLKVLAVFRSEKTGTIAGGMVVDGKLAPKAEVRILRKEIEVGTGKIDSLQSSKSEVPEARMGSECGLKVKSKTPVLVGDLLEAYVEERKERKLS